MTDKKESQRSNGIHLTYTVVTKFSVVYADNILAMKMRSPFLFYVVNNIHIIIYYKKKLFVINELNAMTQPKLSTCLPYQ